MSRPAEELSAPLFGLFYGYLSWPLTTAIFIRSYLKKVFWPNFFVGASFKILEIREYACGFKLGPAANLNQNPFFGMASKWSI
jgi:hypothetical protein